MRKAAEEALERFDKAAQEYAFRGTWSGSSHYSEIIQEYEWAKADLKEYLK